MQVYSAAASRTKSHETNYIAPVRGKVSRNPVHTPFLQPGAAQTAIGRVADRRRAAHWTKKLV